jgi:hypothetical protein
MPSTSPAAWLADFPAGEREGARATYARMCAGRIAFVPATAAHVDQMVGHLRAGDVAELAAIGLTDRAALEQGLACSIEAWTAVCAGVAMGMYGCTVDAVLGDEGHPWLLTTCWTTPHWLVFARALREAVDRYKGMFSRLSGQTDARYAPAVRLLTWLGFSIAPGDGPVAFSWSVVSCQKAGKQGSEGAGLPCSLSDN